MAGRSAKVRALLAWYDVHRRKLPWRVGPGGSPDPYAVWLSEIMLQQTTVATVEKRFAEFLARWPTVTDLAAASQEDVLARWAGLGYYARARNLHRCAIEVVERHGGVFRGTADALEALPGIGAYTAAAIAAIAFDQPIVPVDGNIERVTARMFAIGEPLPSAKSLIGSKAQSFLDTERPGDVAQALMDLGAMICRPKSPLCEDCPLGEVCEAYRTENREAFPVKPAKKHRPLRKGYAFCLLTPAVDHPEAAILLRRRPEKGLLGGMAEIPGSEWSEHAGEAAPPLDADWQRQAKPVTHRFTHFDLELEVWAACATRTNPAPPYWWHRLDDIASAGLPTVMKKVLDRALEG